MRISGQITDGKPKSNDKERFQKWLDRNEGLWFKAEYKIAGKHKCPKTKDQLGYYWAHLLPEITKQLIDDGYTLTIEIKKVKLDIPYTEEATHELLTALCGHVGDDGKQIRLSDDDMTLTRMIHFISNVLDVAVVHLKMNAEKLKAKRPK